MKHSMNKLFYKYNQIFNPPVLTRENNDIYVEMNLYRQMPSILFATIYDNHIYINDFKAKIKGTGRGTLMMEKLIQYAKSTGLSYIDGIITPYDHTQTAYIEHFYNKFGFSLTPVNKPETKFYIRLDL